MSKFSEGENLAAVKKYIRRTSNAFDDEIKADINACIADLKLAGVNYYAFPQALILQAVKFYCRWTNDFKGNGAGYKLAYDELRTKLAIDSLGGDDTDE